MATPLLPDDPLLREALALLAARRFFEAHEVLEARWREAEGADRRLLQGLLHLAVACEHWKRGNPRSARGQWEKAREKLSGVPEGQAGLRPGATLQNWGAFWERQGLEAAVEAQARGEEAGGSFTGAVPGVERAGGEVWTHLPGG